MQVEQIDVKRKQKLLFSEDISTTVLNKHAESFFDAGWYNDAIDFWARAENSEGLGRVKAQAVEQGDSFLFSKCLRMLGESADPAQWLQVADRALELAKLQFAREAYRVAGSRKALEKVEGLLESLNDRLAGFYKTQAEPEKEKEG
jgi:hypothetical protein